MASTLALFSFITFHVGSSLVLLDENVPLTPKTALLAIQDDFLEQAKLELGKNDTMDECFLSDTESCELSMLSDEHTTLVYTGGETRCIFDDSTPYSFQVVRGDPKKVLFYFAGGGACWNEPSTSTREPLCKTDTAPSSLIGIFSRDAEENPEYHDHTFIQVLYCSGDVHTGNTTRSYNEYGTTNPAVQVGALNTMAVLDWLTAQNLGVLDELIVGGTSAGSVGAQVWSDYIIDHIPASNVATLFDSFAGVFPPGAVGPMVQGFGVCKTPVFQGLPDLEDKCKSGDLLLQDLVINALVSHPDVAFVHLNSKTDWIQQAYYVMIGALNETLSAYITPTMYYLEVNQVFEQYHQYPNHVAFLVDASKHVYTNGPLFFTADTNSMSGSDQLSERLFDFVGSMPLGSGHGDGNLTWACAGEHISLEEANSTQARPHSYCDEALTDRVIYASSP